MPFRPFIDRASTVALGIQLKGQVEYAIACGELAPGARLPTVRQLAEHLGVSPVTVSQVYRELKWAGLLIARPGRGTFVTEAIGVAVGDDHGRHVDALMDAVAAEGRRMGLDDAQLVHRFAAHLEHNQLHGQKITVVVVGVFPAATQGYADRLQAGLAGLARVRGTTFDDIEAGNTASTADVDLYVTLPYRVSELRELVGDAALVSYLRFLPSRQTRASLADIDPRQHVLGVARLPGFLSALEAGIARYAPHVPGVDYCLVTDPHLPNMLAAADVVVYASGADSVRAQLGGHERAFEYRHDPDAAFVEAHLLPLVRALRAGRSLPDVPPPPNEGDRPADAGA